MTKRVPEKGLRFNPGNHSYYLDGERVQGVTTLIKQGFPKDALMYWSARSVAEHVADNPEDVAMLRMMGRGPMVAALKEVPWQKRDTAAVRGTDVHRFAEQLANGEEPEVPVPLVPYVEACLDFFDDYDIEPTLTEAAVGSREHKYAGTLDLVANDIIWDYKTSASGIFCETAFQESAYANAEFHGLLGDEHPMPTITGANAVWLRADGEYDVVPLEFGPHVFAEFLAISEVARIAKRAKGTKVKPGYVHPALEREQESA